jgi:hypothetical protein
MSSARSITAAVNPPRAVYLDYPLGHTAGKVNDPDNQLNIMKDTLAAFETIETPGTIVDLDYRWRSSDTWKDNVMRPKSANPPDKEKDTSAGEHDDDRVARFDTPQYQDPEDELLADTQCPSCVFLEASK